MPSHGSTQPSSMKKRLADAQSHHIENSVSSASKKARSQVSYSHNSGISSSSGKDSASAPRETPSHRSAASSVKTDRSARRFDGNTDPSSAEVRNPATAKPIIDPRNFDLGMVAWSTVRGYDVPTMPLRPGFSSLGKEQRTGLNSFAVETYNTKKVYQFDVHVGSGTEKRGVIRKVWESRPVQQALGKGWIFDGNRLAWSANPIEREIRIKVDLDVENGQQTRADKPNEFRISIRQTNLVRFDVLDSHLSGKAPFDNSVLESINFLDHLLREWPSTRLTSIKRSFFPRGSNKPKPFDLGTGVEGQKGVYQSLRISSGPTRAQLSVNVDVANVAFYKHTQLLTLASELAGARDPSSFANIFARPGKTRDDVIKKLRKLHVLANHRGANLIDEYVIEGFSSNGARNEKFDFLDKNTGQKKTITVYDHFAKHYNVRLSQPDLPLVRMTKNKGKTLLPMEVLKVKENQRYPFKLDDRQTSNMIKVAATPPGQRWEAIEQGLRMLDWPNDPIHKFFGLKINLAKMVTPSRLLVAPKVQFGAGSSANPGTSGRWDLKGKKFAQPNQAPLKSWAVCVISGRRGGKPDKAILENFIREFCKIYTNHGGRVDNKQPVMILQTGDDVGSAVTATWNAAGNQANARPQMLVFILPDKDANTYGRIKRSAECRYGVVSQCMQYAHVMKGQAQYMSNVCMKFNAKLGGITCTAKGPKSNDKLGVFTVPTVIMGADVSHAGPGAATPSMAALTMSQDALAAKYSVMCQTNGFRVEMITTENINGLMKPQLQNWIQNIGNGAFPKRIIYIRDGVSEGQYQHVLQQEVHDMKKLLKTADPKLNIPFVVLVGTKRHHVRFFPEGNSADRNGNPLPGTLVERGVTHPFENDFYLCAHAAIKGTARPVHYYVLLNEAGMTNDEIHTMLYEHAYQYQRATTPISLHPAIYYAHLASNRAVPHDPKWGGSSDATPTQAGGRGGSQSGSQGGRSGGAGSGSRGPSSGMPVVVEKLLPMPSTGNISQVMWYI